MTARFLLAKFVQPKAHGATDIGVIVGSMAILTRGSSNHDKHDQEHHHAKHEIVSRFFIGLDSISISCPLTIEPQRKKKQHR